MTNIITKVMQKETVHFEQSLLTYKNKIQFLIDLLVGLVIIAVVHGLIK
ncbi:hypothetical protein [Abyssisolibacter fermentans]|nr:hypothetical protein [Abyssisolibacter fermentans]